MTDERDAPATDGAGAGTAIAAPVPSPAPAGEASAPTPAPRRRRHRLAAAAIATGIVGGIVVFTAGVVVPPLSETCPSPPYVDDECHLTVDAAMRRGLGPVHPVILWATGEPGPDRATGMLGHRDTVAFGMLGIPSPTTVDLYFDVGAHWGGEPTRTAGELAAWAVGVAVAAGALLAAAVAVVVAGVAALVRRARA